MLGSTAGTVLLLYGVGLVVLSVVVAWCFPDLFKVD